MGRIQLGKCQTVSIQQFCILLASVLAARTQLSVLSLSVLIGIDQDRVMRLLDPLRAVIYVPGDVEDDSLSIFHASFADFLSERAPEHLRIPLECGHSIMANVCLAVMKSDALHFNVSRCPSSYKSNVDQILAPIPLSVIYACLHWSAHFIAAGDIPRLAASLESVFSEKFLFWIEVLSATGSIRLASGYIVRLLTTEHIVRTSIRLWYHLLTSYSLSI